MKDNALPRKRLALVVISLLAFLASGCSNLEARQDQRYVDNWRWLTACLNKSRCP